MTTTLTTVTRTQGNNAALKDGSVRPKGFLLDFEEVPVLVHAFRRMVRSLDFDVSEMAVTTYLCAKAHGVRFTALPVFLVRGFHHAAIAVTRDSEVRRPQDLEGRRVGVNRGYTVTTGVWARAILHEEHGVDLDRVTWVLSGDEHVAEYQPPPNVVPADGGRSLEELLLSGELAAVIGADIQHPDVVPLIDDPETAARTALRDRGFYPVNHLVVVKDEVLEAHPGVAEAVYDAFTEAKDRYVEQLRRNAIEEPTATDRFYRTVLEDTGVDPLPYGLAANREMLEVLMGHAVRQHILDAPLPMEGLFAGPQQ